MFRIICREFVTAVLDLVDASKGILNYLVWKISCCASGHKLKWFLEIYQPKGTKAWSHPAACEVSMSVACGTSVV